MVRDGWQCLPLRGVRSTIPADRCDGEALRVLPDLALASCADIFETVDLALLRSLAPSERGKVRRARITFAYDFRTGRACLVRGTAFTETSVMEPFDRYRAVTSRVRVASVARMAGVATAKLEPVRILTLASKLPSGCRDCFHEPVPLLNRTASSCPTRRLASWRSARKRFNSRRARSSDQVE